MRSLVTLLFIIPSLVAAGQTQFSFTGAIPILCYHNIKTTIEGHQSDYTIARQRFREHLKILSDSGYHSITPDQLYQFLDHGNPLPDKPVMITFDDNHVEHFTAAAPLLRQFGFSGVFFIMTVTIGKPGYMSADQIRQLSMDGHFIGAHTWDHPDMRKLSDQQWRLQVDLPRKTLEKITGKPVPDMAYPYGAWNDSTIRQLRSRGTRMAFQLTGKTSTVAPLYTIRRLEVAGNWPAIKLLEMMRSTFSRKTP